MAKGEDKSGRAERRREWTVMVYMAAENSSELDAVAVEDLKEMERGVNDDVHVAVQINRAWPTVPQRYEIRTSGPSQLPNKDSTLTNMGSGETLTGFLKWAVQKFPAKHYCLVLWGHAYGLGFGRDHGDALTLKELRAALEEFRKERQIHEEPQSNNADLRLELLGANACAMSYVEAAYELRNHAQYMVASQISVPFAGWPYELILGTIDSDTTTRSLGQLVVDAYVSHFNGLVGGERVTMSLLNLGALEVSGFDFKDLIDRLALAIRDESRTGGPFGDRRAYVRDVFLAAASGDVRPLIDLKDLCGDLKDLCQDPSDSQSRDLCDAIDKILDFLPRFVVRHKGHPELLEDLHGVGIFAPFVAGDEDLKRLELLDDGRNRSTPRMTGKQAYEGLALFGGGEKVWPRLVYQELRQAAPSELLSSLTGLGASGRTDRREITQIVLAIESSFNKLDHVLAEGRSRLDAALESSLKREPTAQEARSAESEGNKRFAPPWLKLIPAPALNAQVATLKQLFTLKAFEQAATVSAKGETGAIDFGSIAEPNIGSFAVDPALLDPLQGADPQLVNAAVDFFIRAEKSIGEVERATLKGLTNARLGLGPSAPDRFTFAEDPKPSGTGHGFAEDPKPSGVGHGFVDEDPKPSGTGHGSNGFPGGARDLRVDLAFARVIELFGQASKSLRQVEDATLALETIARATFSSARRQHLSRTEMLEAAAGEIRRGLELLEESSKNARRTVRGVFSHPVYGLGPGSDAIGLEERQALANAGGLSRRNLRLL